MKGGKGKLIQVKHLHLIRCEELSSGRDCIVVLYSTWNRVRPTKVGDGILITVGIVSNLDVTFTKYWTIT